jgi:hypothetical protein
MIAVATPSSVAGDSGHSLSPGIRTLSLLSSRTPEERRRRWYTEAGRPAETGDYPPIRRRL